VESHYDQDAKDQHKPARQATPTTADILISVASLPHHSLPMDLAVVRIGQPAEIKL